MHAAILGWKKSYTHGIIIGSVAEFQEVLERDSLVYVPLWKAPVHKGWIMGLRYREIVRMIDACQIYTAKKKDKGEQPSKERCHYCGGSPHEHNVCPDYEAYWANGKRQ